MSNGVKHKILGDKVALYRRPNSSRWHCSASIKGRQYRATTKQDSLKAAKDVAQDWYMELLNKDRFGELSSGKTFREAAKKFELEYETITNGRRSPKWVQGHKDRLRLHLLPFLGSKSLKEITSGVGQEYGVHRMTKPKNWDVDHFDDDKLEPKPWKHPARNTIHNEIVTMSMVLKAAQRHGWVEFIPDLSDPYRRQSKVEHRPWFTPKEYKQFMKRPERMPQTLKRNDTSGMRSSCMTMCFFWLIQACGLMRPSVLSIETLR